MIESAVLNRAPTRNYFIQDNLLGIISYEGINGKRGHTFYDEPEYIKKDKEVSISTMQCGANRTEDIYYSIQIND